MRNRWGVRSQIQRTACDGTGEDEKNSNPLQVTGAGGRNRTGTVSPPADFESAASTNFATPAGAVKCEVAIMAQAGLLSARKMQGIVHAQADAQHVA
jgi:hypothetical protein